MPRCLPDLSTKPLRLRCARHASGPARNTSMKSKTICARGLKRLPTSRRCICAEPGQTVQPAAAKSYWVKQMKGITKCRHLIEKINQGWIDPKMGEEAVCSLAEDTFTLQ